MASLYFYRFFISCGAKIFLSNFPSFSNLMEKWMNMHSEILLVTFYLFQVGQGTRLFFASSTPTDLRASAF